MKNLIFKHWTNLCSEKISERDRRDLILAIYNISFSFIKIKYHNHEILTFPNSNPENLAAETTEFLFAINKSNRLRIIEYMNKHSERIEKNCEWLYFFYRSIEKAVDKVVNFQMLKWNLVEFKY